MTFNSNQWAIILGGSSGFGLATAKKLAANGMNICIVHRDRKGAMARIEPHFDTLRQSGVKVITYNTNALLEDNINSVLSDLKQHMASSDTVKMLLHSIAFGNLKLLTKQHESTKISHGSIIQQLSESLDIDKNTLQEKIDTLFNDGLDALVNVTTPPEYNNTNFLGEEDFSLTVHSMGTSLATWVKATFSQNLFDKDARILGLTSEGNEISWRGYAAVSAAKVALESVARAIAVEYAPYGIRANIIQAGVTDTPALRLIPGSTHMKSVAKMRNPFSRLTTPADVANFIYLMCLDEASWANGNVIRVDGGEHISG